MISLLGIGSGALRPHGLVASVTLAAVVLGAPGVGHAQRGGASESGYAGQRVLPLRHRDAREVLPQVRSLTAGARGEVSLASEGNQLVVRGPEAALALAQQVVESLDQPNAAPTLQSYAVPPERQAAVIRWTHQFRSGEGESVAWDARTGQLIVVANPEVHDQVRAMLGGQPAARRRAPERTAVRLAHLAPKEVHQRLERLAGRPLPATWDSQRRWLSFPVRMGEGATVEAVIDAQKGDVKLGGPAAQVEAWTHVIQALDAAPDPRETTEVVATESARSPAVRQALAVIEESSGPRPPDTRLASAMMQQDQPGAAQPGAAQPGATQPGAEQPEAIPGTREQAEFIQDVADSQAGSLLGPVDVQFIEGLDIIVIRGNQQDVQRVLEIIQEIEQKSLETAPAIRVHELRFVDSVTMASLLNRVYQEALTQRTGGVTIIPLGRPNALLLIGREETVRFAVEQLIEPLDSEFDSSGLFRVFPLEHASAVDAQELVQEFLADPEDVDEEDQPELPTRAIVVADYRSNSLLVRASPRTLMEIDKLLQEIDTGVAAAMDEVRVFQLRNARAQELADLLTTAITEGAGAPAGEAGEGARATGLQLMTVDAETQQMLRSGVLTNVRIAPDARNNSLVVTAPPQSMSLIAALIESLDSAPTAEAEIKVFTIANGDAVALRDMLVSLFGGADQADPEAGGLSAGVDSIVRLQFSVDERTNSIIAAGSVNDLAIVEAILLRLDGSETRERITQVYRLKNAPAFETADAINQYIQQQREIEESAELAIGPFAQLEREIIVVPETVSNSLIVSAAPGYFEKIEQLIEDIDERPPMVMIQVLIAEVTLNDTDEFGVELGLQDPLLFDRSVVGELSTITTTVNTPSPGGTISTQTQEIINAPLSPGFNFNDVQNTLGNNGSDQALNNAQNVAAQALSNFGVGRFNSELGFGGFVFSAGSSSVNMLLRALQENRRLEVLSRPQIMALDNQIGTIRVGARVPTIQGVSQLATGAQQNEVTYQDVGIILTVQPRISPDDQVVMYVGAEKSQLGPESEGVPIFASPGGQVVRAPVINQTIAETTVAAASGQTVVLSGLLTKETSEIHRRVPLISNVPLLGDLFRYDSVSEARSELLIIMTPRVIRSEVDSDMIKQIESSRMSWVMCDVVNMHGPSGLRSRCDEWGPGEAPEVYPDYVPQDGELLPPDSGLQQPVQPEMGPVQPEMAPVEPEMGPVQPEMWNSGASNEPAASERVTPVGYSPASAASGAQEPRPSGASQPAAASRVRRLPPAK